MEQHSGVSLDDASLKEWRKPVEMALKRRRSAVEVRRCKKEVREDLKLCEWDQFQYAHGDICSRPIRYEGCTLAIKRVRREDISPQWFYDNAAKASCPMIVEDACKNWPAMHRWEIPDLERRFRNTFFKVGADDKGRRVKMKLKNFIDYAVTQQDDHPLYLFEPSLDSHADIATLKDDYETPDIFPHDWFTLVNWQIRPSFRSWSIGPKRSGAPVHTDPMGMSSWTVLTSGMRRWVLFHPSVCKRTAKGVDYIRNHESQEAVNYFDFILPRIKDANPELQVYEVLQKTGDIMFVPSGWWQSHINLEVSVAVSQRYVGPDNFEPVWKHIRSDCAKLGRLWCRNMKKFAPELHRWACELNSRDGFLMGHGLDGESSIAAPEEVDSPSDSSSDDANDVETSALSVGLKEIEEGLSAAVQQRQMIADTFTALKKRRCQDSVSVTEPQSLDDSA